MTPDLREALDTLRAHNDACSLQIERDALALIEQRLMEYEREVQRLREAYTNRVLARAGDSPDEKP